jgi:hypothetical protein
MDLLYGIKGVLPVICVIFIAVAVTNDDTLTRVIMGMLGGGLAVGMAWDPVAKLIAGRKKPSRD